jgi:hypothetical protein
MGLFSFARAAWLVVLAACLAGCDHHCGLGEHNRVTVLGGVDCCGAASFKDVALAGATSDSEFSLSNTAFADNAGGFDAYLVPTTCDKLFDGPYPGAAPLCTIYAGPAKTGGVSGRVKLNPGTYRVYVQGYSDVNASVHYLVDVYIWDYSCGGLIQ